MRIKIIELGKRYIVGCERLEDPPGPGAWSRLQDMLNHLNNRLKWFAEEN